MKWCEECENYKPKEFKDIVQIRWVAKDGTLKQEALEEI